MKSKILFVLLIFGSGAQSSNCPLITNRAATAGDKIYALESIFQTSRYDNSLTKYFVMTPSSSPNFVNYNGEPFDWANSECVGRPVLFNCHGWLDDGNAAWAHTLLATFITEYGGCGVSSDYPGAAKNYNYLSAVQETNNVAQGLSAYISDHICRVVDCSADLILHGVSLGAHTCGVAGYLLKHNYELIVPRMIGSDAAGPAYHLANASDGSLHLSKESARTVINIKTSCIYGSSLTEWAHQTQIVGDLCGCHQTQCPKSSESCNHASSVVLVKTTMESDFKDIKVKKCSPCSCIMPKYDKPPVEDSLGWKSSGIPGVFKSGKITECLNLAGWGNEAESKRRKRRSRRH